MLSPSIARWVERRLCAGALLLAIPAFAARPSIPEEPVRIGSEPQFLFDQYIVDNTWALSYKRQAVRRVVHPATKHPANPVLTGDQPSFLTVARDPEKGLFRMYYQANFLVTGTGPVGRQPQSRTQAAVAARGEGRKYRTYIACAESTDGLRWTRPHLNLFPWFKGRPNNLVIAQRDNPAFETCSPMLLELPESDRAGFRWWILYRAKGRGGGAVNGIRAAASRDGIHFEEADDHRLYHLHSDHPNTLVHDPERGEYVIYCRPKDKYRAWGENMLDTGASRRVARIANDRLLEGWGEKGGPQTILVPDERDQERHFNFFYGMPVRLYAGVYFGFLEPFRMNDLIDTELAISRDGVNWLRFDPRRPFIPRGEEGAWDDTMVFGSPSWIEVGDQWWFYYSGWDGPHGTTERTGAIGLATLRKEGFVSLRAPRGGGVICTRRLIWPGGDLWVNADATEGELKVRLSDARRRPLPGFDYDDCVAFSGNAVRHRVQWRDSTIRDLKGSEVRIEFYFRDADLFTFQAR